jgi:hypothetical protein
MLGYVDCKGEDMRMNLGKRFIILSIVSVAVLGCAIKKTHAVLFSVHGCSVTIDPILSHQTHQQITDFFNKNEELQDVSLKDIVAAVQKKFFCVESVAVKRCASGSLDIGISAVKPLCNINSDKVLVVNGTIFANDVFTDSSREKLDTLFVRLEQEELDKVREKLRKFTQKLIPSIYSQYDVVWFNEREVRLIDKKDSWFVTVCNAYKVPNEQSLAYINRIKQDIFPKKGRKNIRWVADMRFNDQIIVSSGKGGSHE